MNLSAFWKGFCTWCAYANTSRCVGVASELTLSRRWIISMCTYVWPLFSDSASALLLFHDHKRPWGFHCVGRRSRSSSAANSWTFDFDITEWTVQVIDLLVVVSVFGVLMASPGMESEIQKTNSQAENQAVHSISVFYYTNMFPFFTIFAFASTRNFSQARRHCGHGVCIYVWMRLNLSWRNWHYWLLALSCR